MSEDLLTPEKSLKELEKDRIFITKDSN